MTKSPLALALGLLGLIACSSDKPAGGGGAGSSSGSGGATGTGGQTTSGSGGRPAGSTGGTTGAATGGTTGTPSGSGGSASTGGSSGSGGSTVVEPGPTQDGGADTKADAPTASDAPKDTTPTTEGGVASKDFVCSWILGITTTGEWYRAGFETVVDNARWQVTPIEMGHLEKWADPKHPIWNEAIQSPCAQNSKTPDRIVFMATKYEWTTLQEFIPAYVDFVNNIKTKYPTVKRIDLMTYGRAPGNKECVGANRPSYSWIKPVQDEAAAMVATMFPGFVFVCPKWEHKACSDFDLCPHVNATANATLAKTIGAYFLLN